jgi:hypothetical protein
MIKVIGRAGSLCGKQLWIYRNPPKGDPIVFECKSEKIAWELYCNWVELLMEGTQIMDYRILTDAEAAAASSKVADYLASTK